MALMEAVDAHPRATLVVTTTQVTDAFGDSTQAVLDAMAEARSLMARREHVLRPSEEADLPKILARRLFERVDAKAARPVADGLRARRSRLPPSAGTDLPEHMRDPRWVAELEESYPFHPDAHPRARQAALDDPELPAHPRRAPPPRSRDDAPCGSGEPDDADLIRLDHVDLAEREIAEDLSSRLDRATFDAVIRADVCSQAGGEPSHAELVDQQMGVGLRAPAGDRRLPASRSPRTFPA